MATLVSEVRAPVAFRVARSPLLALRDALVQKLIDDKALTALSGSAPVHFRPAKQIVVVPSITYFDFGTQPDATVPLMDRTVQIDVWERDIDVAEAVADRIRQLLDLKPLPISDGRASVVLLHLEADRDEVDEQGDVARKVLEFRLLAYRLVD